MSERKTQPTKASVKAFIAGVSNDRRRQDSESVLKIMKKVSRKQPVLWGPTIIGFGLHEYRLASGKDEQICKIGFSPRAQALAFYLGNYPGRAQALKRLGKYRMGNGGCLYINKLDDVDVSVLEEIIHSAYHNKKTAEQQKS